MEYPNYPSIEEFKASRIGFEETYMINELGYWWKREIANIYCINWTFEKGDHISCWWYPSYMGHTGDVWEILNGCWFLNPVTGESDCPNGGSFLKYCDVLNDPKKNIVVTPSKFKCVMGRNLSSNNVENWGEAVMRDLEEYKERVSKRRYL